MIRYQYVTKNTKFISRHLLKIDQYDAKFRSNELQSKLGKYLDSKDKILNYYLKNKLLSLHSETQRNTAKHSETPRNTAKNLPRINIVTFLIEFINSNRISNIFSFGAGLGVNEYLLKVCLSKDSKVIALDFNKLSIEKIGLFFPEVVAYEFNFFTDKIEDIIGKSYLLNSLAIFISSSYVLNDEDFVKLFSSLKKQGVKYIIDFNSGFINNKIFIRECIKMFLNYMKIDNLFYIKPKLDEIISFQGYSRTKNHYRSLYQQSGCKVLKEISISTYDYVAILELK